MQQVYLVRFWQSYPDDSVLVTDSAWLSEQDAEQRSRELGNAWVDSYDLHPASVAA